MERLFMIDNCLADAGEISTASFDQINFLANSHLFNCPLSSSFPLVDLRPTYRIETPFRQTGNVIEPRSLQNHLESRRLEVIERVDPFDAIAVGQHGFIPLL
jgi:hypothetical protein